MWHGLADALLSRPADPVRLESPGTSLFRPSSAGVLAHWRAARSPFGTDQEPHDQTDHRQKQDEQYPQYFFRGRGAAVDDLGDRPDGQNQKYKSEEAGYF